MRWLNTLFPYGVFIECTNAISVLTFFSSLSLLFVTLSFALVIFYINRYQLPYGLMSTIFNIHPANINALNMS